MIRNKKVASFLFCSFFAMTTIVQVLNVTPVFAAPKAGPIASGGSVYTRATLQNQLKIIKYYAAFKACANADGSSNREVSSNNLNVPLDNGHLVAPEWFQKGDTTGIIGVIADSDDHNGQRSCDDIVKDTMDSGGVFGFSSYSDAGSKLGLQKKNATAGDVITALSNHLFNTPDQDLGSIYSQNGKRYYDLFYTAQLSVCDAHKASSQTDPDLIKNPSTYKIYVVDGTTGKVKTEYWTFPKANDHDVSYGWSTDGTSGGSGKLSCVDIAKKLAQKGPAQDYAVYVKNHPDENPPDVSGSDDGGKDPSTCNIDGIGWIICPVLNFMANIIDQSYKVVDAMLTVNAFNSTGSDNQLKDAWSSMRNIANVAFVIVFLFIIYSQITGFGVSNYGIKKMLPRIIIAAILVNASYWLCALAVDISNVLGDSMKSLFSGLGGTFDPKISWVKNGSGWAGIVGGVVAGSIATGAILYVGLAALVPALVGAIIAIVTVLLVLVIRQALIILLIVVAPLAFVAFLLPNTQQWFKKWRELFQILLLMYPIIGAIFGASQLASNIVMNSANGYSDEALKMAIQVMGAAIAIIPLFITPVVMKTAGGVLNNIAGKINDPNKGPFDRMRKGAQGFRDSKKSDMRARRINYGDGKNGVSRTWRRAAGLTTRTGVRMKSGASRAKAAEEAAEAGLLMNDQNAIEAARLGMAGSAAKSALQSKAIKGIDDRQAQQVAAIGQSLDEDGAIASTELNAAIRSQISQGEKQAVQEQEARMAPLDASQLGQELERAIERGDKFAALAAQNKLSTMGNKGVDVIAESIDKREKAGNNANWDEVRTEMARNMGPVMGKNEMLKIWATSTSANSKGELTSGDSMENITNKTLEANGTASKLSIEKFASQTPSVQKQMLAQNSITPGTLSQETLSIALSEKNVGSFDADVVAEMKRQLATAAGAAAAGAGAASGGGGGSTPSTGSTPGTGPDHGYL